MGVEEARLLGHNIINYILDLGKDIAYSAISFKYIASTDELVPIAIIIHPTDNIFKDLSINIISRMLNEAKGYIYGSSNDAGILLPINNSFDLYNKIATIIPQIIKQLLNKDVKPMIIGYDTEVL